MELEDAVRDMIADGRDLDAVALEVAEKMSTAPTASALELARATYLSERQLHRRCTAAFGYGPAFLLRINRIQRFLQLARGSLRPRGLAELAVAAGYADQSHLTREVRSILETTPAQLLRTSPECPIGSRPKPSSGARCWYDVLPRHQGRDSLQDAELYWLSTVRPDGRPHVTPLLGVWLDGALYFCTGPDERKAQNLGQNPRCILTTGRNTLEDGLDVVVEGEAGKVSEEAERRQVADAYESKYGAHFTAPEGTWFGLDDMMRAGDALLYRVVPTKAFGFGKGRPFSQTRWRFPQLGSRKRA